MMAQRMSVALHMAAAWEVARELSLAGAEDEAALFGGGVADSVASKFSSYLAPPPHMCRNLVHPPVLRYQAISRNLRLFWDAMGVVCA